MLWHFLKLSSQLSNALKVSTLRSFANPRAFSCKRGPEIGRFLLVISLTHSNMSRFIYIFPVWHLSHCLQNGSLLSKSAIILSLFFKMSKICIFPTANVSAKSDSPNRFCLEFYNMDLFFQCKSLVFLVHAWFANNFQSHRGVNPRILQATKKYLVIFKKTKNINPTNV